ncbi:putative membrane protein [Halapricum desulfuricans]|uniref:Putative membrane protein n=1 Tax=Halapricum desulfuricans TaxID=2841257 RepID=A0A897NGU5_9EURY|nr:hypothetical protein [Halapricum desulfuricans]QSG11561.1 putative membrane protein [Halapricum desulfuricans]
MGETAFRTRLPDPEQVRRRLVDAGLVFDGIQHLRHGESRAEYAHLQDHDGGALSGVLLALVQRLLEPFRL